MTKETDCIIAAINATDIEHAVTDINTDGAHAKNGNHYALDCTAQLPAHPLDTKNGKEGRAVDFAQKKGDGKHDTPGLFAIYQFFNDNYARNGLLTELFYAGPGADHCVFRGKFQLWSDLDSSTRNALQSIHHNHVHVAVKKNVFLTPVEEDEEDDMPKPTDRVDACLAPGGGVWVLTYDGGVQNRGGAPFFGSYPGLPASRTKGHRNFIAIEAEGDGYTIISDDDNGSKYHFNQEVFDRLQHHRGRNQ
jgi:hypothetical protein